VVYEFDFDLDFRFSYVVIGVEHLPHR
jgi:hypothetical protein